MSNQELRLVLRCITVMLLLIPITGATYDVVSDIASNSTQFTTTATYQELHNISLITGAGITYLTASWDARMNFSAPLYGRFMRDGISLGRFNLTQSVYAQVGSYGIAFNETAGTHYYGWEVYSNKLGTIYSRNFSAVFLKNGTYGTGGSGNITSITGSPAGTLDCTGTDTVTCTLNPQGTNFRNDTIASQGSSITSLQGNDTSHDSKITTIQSNETTYVKTDNTSYVLTNNASYVLVTNASYVLTSNGSYVLTSNNSYVLTSNGSYVKTDNASYVLTSNSSYVKTDNASYVLVTNASYVLTSNNSYVKTDNTSYVLTNNATYVKTDNASYVLTSNGSYVLISNTSYVTTPSITLCSSTQRHNFTGSSWTCVSDLTSSFSLAKWGESYITGTAHLVEGTGVTLTQSGNNITISMPAAGITNATANPYSMNASNLTSGTVSQSRLPTIPEANLSLNYATHAQAHTLNGTDHTGNLNWSRLANITMNLSATGNLTGLLADAYISNATSWNGRLDVAGGSGAIEVTEAPANTIAISCKQVSGSQTGCLDATNFTTFNSKMSNPAAANLNMSNYSITNVGTPFCSGFSYCISDQSGTIIAVNGTTQNVVSGTNAESVIENSIQDNSTILLMSLFNVGTLDIQKNNVTISGMGPQTGFNTSNATGVYVLNSNDVTLKDFTVWGNNGAGTDGNILVDYSDRVTIDTIKSMNSVGQSIKARWSRYTTVKNSYIENTPAGKAGILVTHYPDEMNWSNSTVSNNKIINAGGESVGVYYASGNIISDNIGLSVLPYAISASGHLAAEHGNYNIYEGNIINSLNSYGISILNSDHNIFEGNLLYANESIWFYGTSNNNSVSDNQLYSNKHGINVTISGDKNSITENKIFSAGTGYSGISLVSHAGNVHNMSVTGNEIYPDNIVSGINVNVSGAGVGFVNLDLTSKYNKILINNKINISGGTNTFYRPYNHGASATAPTAFGADDSYINSSTHTLNIYDGTRYVTGNGTMGASFSNGSNNISVGTKKKMRQPTDGIITALYVNQTDDVACTGNITVTSSGIYKTHINWSSAANASSTGLSATFTVGEWLLYNMTENTGCTDFTFVQAHTKTS